MNRLCDPSRATPPSSKSPPPVIAADDPAQNCADLDRIRDHIASNPLKWELDRLNPDNPFTL